MNKYIRLLLGSTALFASTAILGNTCIFTVDGGESAVIMDKFKGILPRIYNEGMHFRVPYLQTPYIFQTRYQPKILSCHTGTKDLQVVSITVRILYKPDVQQLCAILLNIGLNYDDQIFPSILNEVVRSVVAQYDAIQLTTNRENVSSQINDTLVERASNFGIKIGNTAIVHIEYSKQFTQSVESKQIAEQYVELCKFKVAQNEELRNVDIIKAEGEAGSAAIINQSLAKYGNGLISIRKIEAAETISQLLSTNPNMHYIINSHKP